MDKKKDYYDKKRTINARQPNALVNPPLLFHVLAFAGCVQMTWCEFWTPRQN